MARRISSFFSTKDETGSHTSSTGQWDTGNQGTYKAPPHNKFSNAPSDLHLNTGMSTDLELPPVITGTGVVSRPSSRDGRQVSRVDTAGSRNSSSSRPQTPTTLGIPTQGSPARDQSPGSAKLNKRKSWLPTKIDRSATVPLPDQGGIQAWIAGLHERVPYDLTPLLNGQVVRFMWLYAQLRGLTCDRSPTFGLTMAMYSFICTRQSWAKDPPLKFPRNYLQTPGRWDTLRSPRIPMAT